MAYVNAKPPTSCEMKARADGLVTKPSAVSVAVCLCQAYREGTGLQPAVHHWAAPGQQQLECLYVTWAETGVQRKGLAQWGVWKSWGLFIPVMNSSKGNSLICLSDLKLGSRTNKVRKKSCNILLLWSHLIRQVLLGNCARRFEGALCYKP